MIARLPDLGLVAYQSYFKYFMRSSVKRTTIFFLVSSVVFFLPGNISAECIEGDCVNGLGTYIWPNGDKYIGEWKNGKRDGIGSFIWPEGDRYVAHWKNDKNNSNGNYISPAGAKLYAVESRNAGVDGFGCIKGDCVNGHGTYTWLSGAKYVGAFENGEKNGPGTYSFPNGLKIPGIWNNGKYVGKKTPTNEIGG